MIETLVEKICIDLFSVPPVTIKRCSEGIGNYVFSVECLDRKYIIRCSGEMDAYQDTIYWLQQLKANCIPAPEIISHGFRDGYDYLVLSYLEGNDIGIIYEKLTANDKRTIAKEIVAIQKKASRLKVKNLPADWSWTAFVRDMLDRAEKRIAENGYFSVDKVQLLRREAEKLDDYFSAIKPVAYLDDISSKNLIIHDGHISGVIDVDWIGIGDQLTYVALTNMALLNLGYCTDYVAYILDEMQVTCEQRRAFLFYTLMYCVDFMGERGTTFLDKTIAVNSQIIEQLNSIFDMLWKEWTDISQI